MAKPNESAVIEDIRKLTGVDISTRLTFIGTNESLVNPNKSKAIYPLLLMLYYFAGGFPEFNSKKRSGKLCIRDAYSTDGHNDHRGGSHKANTEADIGDFGGGTQFVTVKFVHYMKFYKNAIRDALSKEKLLGYFRLGLYSTSATPHIGFTLSTKVKALMPFKSNPDAYWENADDSKLNPLVKKYKVSNPPKETIDSITKSLIIALNSLLKSLGDTRQGTVADTYSYGSAKEGGGTGINVFNGFAPDQSQQVAGTQAQTKTSYWGTIIKDQISLWGEESKEEPKKEEPKKEEPKKTG